MRKIKIIEHISLDGVIEHDDAYEYGGWSAPYRTAEGMGMLMEAQGQSFELILGRRTYDNWSGFWPKAPGPMAEKLNSVTKYVVTHNPESLEWGPVRHIGNDIIKELRGLKATDGPDLVLSGSTSLIAGLLAEGLADEVILIVYPVLLGRGKRFFTETADARQLEFVSSKSTPTGVLLNTYKYAGVLK